MFGFFGFVAWLVVVCCILMFVGFSLRCCGLWYMVCFGVRRVSQLLFFDLYVVVVVCWVLVVCCLWFVGYVVVVGGW